MWRKRLEIDFENIWKKIQRISTREEDQQLNYWLKFDRKNRDFFARAVNHYSKGRSDLPIDIEGALRNVKRRTDNRRLLWIRIASAAAVIIISVSAAFYMLLPDKKNIENATVTSIQIVPGKNKAILILDNGQSYELTPENKVAIDLEEVQVTSEGNKVKYKTKDIITEEPEYNTLKVPLGGEFFLILSDSTKIWLNSGTTLRYPVRFSKNERVVELEGEAYFQVEKAEAPFRVQSLGQTVEVLGTQFNLAAYEDSPAVLTTLVEGELKIFLTDNPGTQEILLSGSQSCFSRDARTLAQYEVNINEFVAWKDGWFVFNHATLKSMMQTLSRWYNVNVIFGNKNSESIRFTGEIRRYDNLNELLFFIEKTNEVKMTIDQQTVIINKNPQY
jgi:ferric-dicitrate binding protein FerR (iron transport regulator)